MPLLPPRPIINRLQNNGLEYSERKGYREGNEPSLRNSALGLELVFLYSRLDGEVTVGDGDLGTAIEKFGGNVLVAIERVLGLYGDRMRTTSRSGMNGEQ